MSEDIIGDERIVIEVNSKFKSRYTRLCKENDSDMSKTGRRLLKTYVEEGEPCQTVTKKAIKVLRRRKSAQ